MNLRCFATTLLASLLSAAPAPAQTPAAPAPPAAARVGVYDSRAVAYAHFVHPEHQAALKRRMAEARAAKAAGDTARYRDLEKQIVAEQKQMHLQVFSTAPIPETMARLAERLPEIQREAAVARIVSKWDERALRGVAPADRIDVTELLVRGCPLSAAQRKTMRELTAREPMALWKARCLTFFNRM